MRILLIEDDKDISELYLNILKDNGFDVETALEGDSGFEKISQGSTECEWICKLSTVIINLLVKSVIVLIYALFIN